MTKVSILLIPFIFAIINYAWCDPDKSMNGAVNRATPMKMTENKSSLQRKGKLTPKPGKSLNRKNTKSQPAPPCRDDEAIKRSTKRDLDFLKAVEERRKARWIDLDQIVRSTDFLPRTYDIGVLSSRELPATKSLNEDPIETISRTFPVGSKDSEGGTKLEAFRRLELKKEEILRELFMGLHFSFTPSSRHIVFQVNVTPLSENGPGLIIPF